MAGQRGFLYEGRVFNKLKSKNLIPVGITPAGADASRPDAVFLYKNLTNIFIYKVKKMSFNQFRI